MQISQKIELAELPKDYTVPIVLGQSEERFGRMSAIFVLL